ncbi:MAG: class I SAM-dependent methyltransferase [Deltaproteobacteria bacterium]|nr:class I SAM-dependent methyltransferase [Deltaproteobacteria bacterium]
MLRPDSHEVNRRSWNAVTPAHNRHKGDQAAFLRDGGTTLFPEEVGLLGDISGRRVAHLQCNCGQDSLSVAALGAEVTGVDISDDAVAFARNLSAASGIPGTFVRSDLFDWLESTEDRFDVAFASYGVLSWLSDLDAYFHGVQRILRQGGRYVLVEFHPVVWIFDGRWNHRYPYTTSGAPLRESGVNDYVAGSEGALGGTIDPNPFHNPHPTDEFPWGLADVIGGALRAGLRLRHFAEYDWSNGCKLQDPMKRLDGNRWTVPDGTPPVPLMYSIVAERP